MNSRKFCEQISSGHGARRGLPWGSSGRILALFSLAVATTSAGGAEPATSASSVFHAFVDASNAFRSTPTAERMAPERFGAEWTSRLLAAAEQEEGDGSARASCLGAAWDLAADTENDALIEQLTQRLVHEYAADWGLRVYWRFKRGDYLYKRAERLGDPRTLADARAELDAALHEVPDHAEAPGNAAVVVAACKAKPGAAQWLLHCVNRLAYIDKRLGRWGQAADWYALGGAIVACPDDAVRKALPQGDPDTPERMMSNEACAAATGGDLERSQSLLQRIANLQNRDFPASFHATLVADVLPGVHGARGRFVTDWMSHHPDDDGTPKLVLRAVAEAAFENRTADAVTWSDLVLSRLRPRLTDPVVRAAALAWGIQARLAVGDKEQAASLGAELSALGPTDETSRTALQAVRDAGIVLAPAGPKSKGSTGGLDK